MSVGETEATRHPELAATVAAVAGWLAAPEFDRATVVLFDGRHAEDLAGFDWPEYRVRGQECLRGGRRECCSRFSGPDLHRSATEAWELAFSLTQRSGSDTSDHGGLCDGVACMKDPKRLA